jgi:hypothetical protein
VANKIPQIVKEVKKFVPASLNYAYQKQISFSQFSTFQQCPHKWALMYRDGHYQSEVSIHMTFGTSMHEAIQHYLDVMYNESIVEADKINLEEYFENKLRENYKKDYEQNKKQHFSSSLELREFFEDGKAILEWFKKKKKRYFNKHNWWLAGIEVPILIAFNSAYKNILYKGYIDVVLYNELSNTIEIIDIKTSTKSWGKDQKQDKVKHSQLILYKKFFSEQFNFPIENIKVTFFIVKRKIWEQSKFPQSRIQTFSPTSGKNSVNQCMKTLNEFVKKTYTSSGTHINTNHSPTPNKNCTYCVFNKTHLCSVNM